MVMLCVADLICADVLAIELLIDIFIIIFTYTATSSFIATVTFCNCVLTLYVHFSMLTYCNEANSCAH